MKNQSKHPSTMDMPQLKSRFLLRRAANVSAIATFIALMSPTAEAAITVVNTGSSVRTTGSGTQSFNINFDARATADAIVLLLSSESNAAAGQVSMTYAGFAFTPAIDHVGARPSIWYLNLAARRL